MPTYFSSLGVETGSLGLFAVMPFVAMWVTDVAWGARVDAMRARGVPARDCRVLSCAIHSVGPAVVLTYMSFVEAMTPVHATLLLTLAVGMGGTAHSSYWANVLDIAPTHCAVLLGVSNTLASFPGVLGNMYVGWVLESGGSWPLVWMSAVALYLVAFAVYWKWCRGDVIWA